jgi:ADP-ribosylglycohydrolase
MNVISKYKGCLIGAAVGDALGMQTEGLNRDEIASVFGVVRDYGRAPISYPNRKLKKGQYTDDTEQIILLTESIVEANEFDVEVFATNIKKWGKKLIEKPSLNRTVGPTSMQAIKNMLSGACWQDSGLNSDSCGSAMRVAPIGLLSSDIDQVVELAALSSRPTHTSTGGVAGAAAIALAVSMNIRDVSIPELIYKIVSRIKKIDQTLAESIQKLVTSPAEDFFGKNGVSSSVYETVPASFFIFINHIDSFEDAMITAANIGGDTDSVACMTGAMLGARLGMDAIPRRWVLGLENREYIERLALELSKVLPCKSFFYGENV